MNKQILHTIGTVAIAGLLMAVVEFAQSKQSYVQETAAESADQLIQVGQPFTISTDPVAGASYQWLHNGVAIVGQTNSTLTIDNIEISDAGFYSCNIAIATNVDVATTDTASLLVFTPDDEGSLDIVVYATPITSGGSSGSCPGKYKGVVNYTLAPPTWGWAPSTNTTIYTASDTTRTNTKVIYVGAYGDIGCDPTTVTIPCPASSPVYRFSIVFSNDIPSTNYPITLSGFVVP